MRRHVEREHAQNQTISVRTNVDLNGLTPVAGDDTPLPEVPLTTTTPVEPILNKRAPSEDAGSAHPVLPELSPTQIPGLGPGLVSSETPLISNGSISDSIFYSVDPVTAAGSGDPPIQLLLTASPISRRTRQTVRIGSPLKNDTASIVNRSRSQGRHAPPTTGKNTCPHCEEHFDHTLVFHRRLKHVNKVTVGTGPHKVEVERGENGKFTCPSCSIWNNQNPEKLRVSGILSDSSRILPDIVHRWQIHLPRCKEEKEGVDLQRPSDDRSSNSGQQTRQSRRVAQRKGVHLDDHRTSMDGIAQSNQMPLPLECGDFDNEEDVDNEGGTASREIHTMDIGIEGSLTPKGSHSDGPDRGSGSCELPATNVSSHRWETGSRAQTRNHDNDNSNDTHIAFDTQVESDERDPSPSITFILSKMNL
jgi:hypothetical protein